MLSQGHAVYLDLFQITGPLECGKNLLFFSKGRENPPTIQPSEAAMLRECRDSIRRHKVDKGHVGLWWLGQMGFLIKTPQGALLSVDAYLTNSCQ